MYTIPPLRLGRSRRPRSEVYVPGADVRGGMSYILIDQARWPLRLVISDIWDARVGICLLVYVTTMDFSVLTPSIASIEKSMATINQTCTSQSHWYCS